MKVTHVRVSAGCTLPHPHESYANIKLFAELTAELTVRDDPHEVVAGLQDEVNVLLSNERAKRIDDLQREHNEAQARRHAEFEKQNAIAVAERNVREAEQKLERLRSGEPESEDLSMQMPGIPF